MTNVQTLDAAQQQECELLVGELFGPELVADPYPLYSRLRELAPVYHSPAADGVVVTSYRLAADVLRRSTIGQGEGENSLVRNTPGFESSTLLQMIADSVNFVDPPRHTQLRRIVARAFTPKAVGNALSSVQACVDGVLDDVAGREEFDVVTDVAKRIPVQIIGNLLGIPKEDHEDLVRWSDGVAKIANPMVTAEMMAEANSAAAHFRDYASALAIERRENPGNDLVSAMVTRMDDDGALTPGEFATQLMAIISAGTETLVGLISNSVVALQQHPAQRERLRADPSLDADAVEEFLRYEPPLQLAFTRVTLEDQELGGVPLKVGTKVITSLASANHDADVIDRPDELDFTRVRPKSLDQLAFGAGVHFCLGASLARLEGRTIIRGILDRFPNLEVDVDRARRGGSPMLRTFASVPAATGKR